MLCQFQTFGVAVLISNFNLWRHHSCIFLISHFKFPLILLYASNSKSSKFSLNINSCIICWSLFYHNLSRIQNNLFFTQLCFILCLIVYNLNLNKSLAIQVIFCIRPTKTIKYQNITEIFVELSTNTIHVNLNHFFKHMSYQFC